MVRMELQLPQLTVDDFKRTWISLCSEKMECREATDYITTLLRGKLIDSGI